ncbi:hypothetical protein ACFQU2_08760 [Siccirubricoccus deserti]
MGEICKFQSNTVEITSEFILKYEFLLSLPNTITPQRCIVNIGLDSALPVVAHEDDNPFGPHRSFFRIFTSAGEWRTVDISIDFVDFLIAHIFSGVIEEWFGTLECVERPRWAEYVCKHLLIFNSIWGHVSSMGLAAFIATYAWAMSGQELRIGDLAYAISIAIVIWAFLKIAAGLVSEAFNDAVGRCLIPTVILVTEGDRRAYAKLKLPKNKVLRSMGSITLGAVFGVFLNVVASYLYAHLTRISG